MANPYANIGPQTNTSKPILNTDQKNPYAEIGPSSRTFNVTSEGPEFLDGRSDEANPYLTIGPQDIDGNPNWWDNLSYGFGMGFGDTARGLTQMFGGEKKIFGLFEMDQTLKQQQAELYARMQTDDGVWAMLGYFGGAILDPVTWLIPVAKAKNIYSMAKLGAISGGFVGALGYVDDEFETDVLPKYLTSTRPGQALLGATGGALIAPAIGKSAELLGKVKLPGGVLSPGDATVKSMNDAALKKVKVVGKMGEHLETIKVRGEKDLKIQNYKENFDTPTKDSINKTNAFSAVRHFMNNYLATPYREKGLIGTIARPFGKEIYDKIPEPLQMIGGKKAMEFLAGQRGLKGIKGTDAAKTGARIGPELGTGVAGAFMGSQFAEEDSPALHKMMYPLLGFAAGVGGLGATRFIPAKRTLGKGTSFEQIKPTNLRELLAVNVIDNYGLPLDVKKMRTTADAMSNHVSGKFMTFVKKLELMSTDEQKLLLNLIEGDNIYGHVPKVYNNLANEGREIIKKFGQWMVDAGLISAEVYQKNINTYIRRVYLKDPAQLAKIGDEIKPRGIHQVVTKAQYENQFKKDIAFQIDAGNDPKLIEKYKNIRLNEPTKVGTKEYNNILNQLINKSKIKGHKGWEIFDVASDSGIGLTAKQKRILTFNETETDAFKAAYKKLGDKELVTIRWQLTKQERKALEQIENLSLAMAETGRIMGGHLGRVHFYNKLASSADSPDPLKRFAFKNPTVEEINKLNLVQIPESVIEKTKKFKFGNLAGLYVPASIADNIIRTQKYITQEPGKFLAAHRSLTQLWKVSKTAFNPTVHVNNTFSNVVLYDAVDGDNMVENLTAAHKAITAGSRKEVSELFELAKNNAVLEAGLIENELKEISKYLSRNPYKAIKTADDEFNQAVSSTKIIYEDIKDSWFGIKTAANAATKLYRYEDQVFRLALFRDRLRKGYSIEDAAYDARRSFIDYDINAPFINTLRRSATPFLAYSYRVLPLLAETAVVRPWKFAKYAAIGYGLNAAGNYFGGGNEEAERALMPQRKQGRLFGVPFFPHRNIKLPTTIEGNSVYMDITRWVPGGDVLDIGAFSGAEKLPGFVAPLQPSFGYIGDVGSALLGYDLFSERKLRGTGGDIVLDWKMRGKKILQNITPNFPFFPGSYTTQRIDKARRGVPSQYRSDELEIGALMRGLGFKVEQADINKLIPTKALEMKKELRAQKGILRELANDFSNKKINEKEYIKKAKVRYSAIEKIVRKYGKVFSKAASGHKKDPKKFIPGLLAIPGEFIGQFGVQSDILPVYDQTEKLFKRQKNPYSTIGIQ